MALSTARSINHILKPLSEAVCATRRLSSDSTATITLETSLPFTGHNIDTPSRSVDTSPKELMTFFNNMAEMRRMEIAADSLYKAKLIRGFCHLYDGQEAVAVGMEAAITRKDCIITAYRDHCIFLGRGGNLVESFAELMGRKDGIVGAQVPLGIGLAFAQKYSKEEYVTFAMYGDGAANQGQLFEALNMAALWDLPAIIVCENNYDGMGTAEWRAAKSPAYYKRGDYVPGLKVDGMDVFAVKQACKFANEHALKNGPIILEMDTYRYHGQSMSDLGSTYRTRDEISGVRQERDPIERIRKLILAHDIATEKELKEIEKEKRKIVDEAIAKAKESPMPDLSELFTNVYVKGFGVEACGADRKEVRATTTTYTVKSHNTVPGEDRVYKDLTPNLGGRDRPSAQITNNTVEVNSYWVTEMLNSLREEPNDALSFFRQLKESGFKHDIQTYMAMIRTFCYWGMDMKLDSLFLEVINSKKECLGFEVNNLFEELVEGLNAEGPNSLVRALDALVKAYASLRMFDEAIDILFQTKRFGFGLSVLSCNYLMNRLVECGKVDMTVAVYKQLKRISVIPNVYTYGIVIKALCRKGNLEEALGIFEEMEKVGETPNEFTYSTYIEGLCSNGRSVVAYELLRAWKGVNVPLDVYAYTAVIRGFVNEKKLQEAEMALLDMEEQGIVLDAFSYGAIINGYCNMGNISKALSFHDKMETRGIKSNCVIVSSILQCLCKNGKACDAVDQFSSFKKKGIFLDEVAYNGVIDALCKLGRFKEAEKMLDEMKDKRMTPDVVHYTTLINGYCLHGKVLDALDLFKEMKEKGLKPDVVTYNVLAGGFSRNGLVKEALHLLDHMKGQRLTPTTVTHNVIIEGLCIGGYVEEAEIFFSSLENKSVEDYAAMVNGYCELGNTKDAYELFVRLSKQGVLIKRKSRLKLLSSLCLEGEYGKALKLFEIVLSLGDATCNIMYSKLIAFLCSAGDMKRARWVFDNMVWRGLTPDVVIYTMMLNGYCRVNSLQNALFLFDDMKKSGISPDIITYTVMLDGHSKNLKRDRLSSDTRSIGEKRDPSVFWSEMKEMELTADVICYTVLIDSHCKSDNIDDAIRLFTEMIDRGLEPDSVTYTALICGYCKQGHVERAKDLVNEMWRKGLQPDSCTISALHHGIIRAKKLHLRHSDNSVKNQR